MPRRGVGSDEVAAARGGARQGLAGAGDVGPHAGLCAIAIPRQQGGEDLPMLGEGLDQAPLAEEGVVPRKFDDFSEVLNHLLKPAVVRDILDPAMEGLVGLEVRFDIPVRRGLFEETMEALQLG